MSEDPKDALAAMRATLDQAIAGFGEQARMLHGYFTALVEAGFTSDQALRLTADFMATLMKNSTGEDS